MFYACYNFHGMISLDSFNGDAGYYYLAFGSKTDRDAWVDDNCLDVRGNVVASACTRSEVADGRACGRRFVIVNGVCRRADWEFSDSHGYDGAEQLRMHGAFPCDSLVG